MESPKSITGGDGNSHSSHPSIYSCTGNCAAIFIDYENVSGLDSAGIQAIIQQVAAEHPVVLVRAYCDWKRLAAHASRLGDIGVELIELPGNCSGKNSADMQLTVDALSVAATNPSVSTFVIVSGDRDFVPLVRKLREWSRSTIVFAPSGRSHEHIKNVAHQYHQLELTKSGNSKSENGKPNPKPSRPKGPATTPPRVSLNNRSLALSATALRNVQRQKYAGKAVADLEPIITLNELCDAMLELDSSFSARQLMGTTNRPVAKLVAALEAAGVLKSVFTSDGSHRGVIATERTDAFRRLAPNLQKLPLVPPKLIQSSTDAIGEVTVLPDPTSAPVDVTATAKVDNDPNSQDLSSEPVVAQVKAQTGQLTLFNFSSLAESEDLPDVGGT